MPVKHLYTLLCEYVFQDANKGQFGFLGVFQNIRLTEAPGGIPQFYVVVGMKAEPGDNVEIALANEDQSWKASLGTYPIPEPTGSDEGKRSATAVAFIVLPNFRFPALGSYQVLLLAGGEIVHSAPFEVRIGEKQDGTD